MTRRRPVVARIDSFSLPTLHHGSLVARSAHAHSERSVRTPFHRR
jgi:hypothetical protein